MHHVVGEVPAGKILKAQRTARMSDLALDNFHPVKAETDQEDVAHLFRREALVSAPVVNEDNRLIGVITVDDIVGVIDEEAEEDLLKLAGMSDTHIYRDVLYTARSRFSWLAVNLLTAIAASIVIGFFEGTINQIVALAVLMPIVASMGGNAGMQAMTVAVRGLATKELSRANAHKIIGKEVLVGAINGASFAIITGIVTALWFQNPALGMIIATAMVVNLIVAGFSGASIPVLLDRFGMDPAVSSSVFLTTVTDVIGFFAFLGLAAMFLV
jgi:magnesium transporter